MAISFLTQIFNSFYRYHVGHVPASHPVKLLVALKYVDDYSFIQIWNATIGLGIMPRI